jgi:prolyl oligopeptidase
MKKYLILLLLFLLGIPNYAQNKPYKQTDYEYLQVLESEENIKWADARKSEAIAYLNTIKILPQIKSWNKEYTSKLKPKYITAVPPSVDQVGEYAEGIMGKMWARMNYDQLVKTNGIIPPTIININALNLPLDGDLLFEKAISRAPEYNDVLMLYKEKGKEILRAVAECDWKEQKMVEGGFRLPPADTEIQWRDENSVYVNTNLESPSETGYQLRLWKRGEDIKDSQILFETKFKKGFLSLQKIENHLFVTDQNAAYNEVYYHLKDDELTQLNLPKDVLKMTIVAGQFIVSLKSGWKPLNTYFPAGSIISIDVNAFLNGDMNFSLITESNQELVIDEFWNTKDVLIIRALENVQSVLYEWTFESGKWQSKRIENPKGNRIEVTRTQSEANRYYIRYADFFKIQEYLRKSDEEIIKFMEFIAPLNEDDYTVEQRFATSKDGTKVPYSIVYKKNLKMEANNPVIMTGYGGWGSSLLPRPHHKFMKWLDDGGVFVTANIRGGGEYGPDWHNAALKQKRQNSYDDFKAVAEDLILKKVTKAGMIGTFGGSNGGLLVANGFIQNPGLFGAVIITNGSIDLLLDTPNRTRNIGAYGERGNPFIPEERAYMKKISPLHALEGGKDYPPVLLLTSRNDDISDCGKSRKFYQRMKDLGYDNVYLIETGGGSHFNTDVPNQKDLELAYFYKNLHPNYEQLINDQ